ncbi:MAG: hypothetical protein ABI288_05530 [Ginsengibacter sp.]
MNKKIILQSIAILIQLFLFPNLHAQITVKGDNLVANGDFMSRDPEQRPLFWTIGKDLQTATISSEQRHGITDDDLSLRVADSSATLNLSVRSEKRIANPGTRYVATAWIKGQTGTPANFYMEFWDQNDKRIGVKIISPALSTEWQQIDIEMQAPEKCTHVTVAIISDEESQGISFWDDIELNYEVAYISQLKNETRELFLDNYHLETMVDIQRIVHPGNKTRPLIVATEPWEGDAVYIYGTVLVDEPKGSGYRMWYTAYSKGNYFLCYATSNDGITWKKPDLGIVDYKGSKKNNICKTGGGTLIYDPYDINIERRYKLMDVVKTDTIRKRPFGYGVFFSKDGIDWKAYEGNPVISYADVSTVAYDESKKLFIASTKQNTSMSNTSVTPNKLDRASFISTSKNFTDWTAPDDPGSDWTLAVEGDFRDDMLVWAKGGIEAQVYGMSIHPYEGIYIGLPWVFDVSSYSSGIFATYGDGGVQPEIASSRDLRLWERPSRDPIIPLGIKGSWDDGAIYTSSKFYQTKDRVYLYYGGMNLAHGGSSATQKQIARIARASWRRDGFVSLSNGGDDTGVATSKEISFTGSKLNVNVNLRSSGSLKVELLDSTGRPIPGFTLSEAKTISGDQLSITVTWKGGNNLAKLKGKKVKLRFHLTNGDLYSYWFT